jgi:hypothetical protein
LTFIPGTIGRRIVARLVLCLAFAGIMPAVAARADVAADFLRTLEGSWRGRGSATIPGRLNPERITCQITNTYEAASGDLVVAGECASTQGKTPVQGKLSHKGNAVSGSIISTLRGATVTTSSGSISGGRLTVSSSLMENATGRLVRTQQVIRKEGGGFEASFFTYDNASGTFKPAGNLMFSAK